jgi:hypothetical protein
MFKEYVCLCSKSTFVYDQRVRFVFHNQRVRLFMFKDCIHSDSHSSFVYIKKIHLSWVQRERTLHSKGTSITFRGNVYEIQRERLLHSKGTSMTFKGNSITFKGNVYCIQRERLLHSKGTLLHSKGTLLHSKGTLLHSKGTLLPSKGTLLHSKGTSITFKGNVYYIQTGHLFILKKYICSHPKSTCVQIQLRHLVKNLPRFVYTSQSRKFTKHVYERVFPRHFSSSTLVCRWTFRPSYS